MGKYNIKKAAIVLLLMTVTEKILGFGREMVIASQFGATGLTDSYIGGYLIPNFITVLLNAGLVNVYTPLFLSEREADEDEAWNKINSVSTYLMLILLIVVLAGILFSHGIVKFLYPGFSENSLNAATAISRIFFIGVLVYSGSIIEGALLNCFKHFVYPVLAVSLLSVGMILFVLTFGGRTNINSIAYGYLIGAAVSFVIQYIKLKNIKARVKINFKTHSDFTSKFIQLLVPVLIATSMGQINVFVDKIFASYLSKGSMSYLSYADKVSQLPVMIFSGMVATIIFPDLIQYINKEDNDKVRVYVNRAIVITMMFLIPSFVGLIVLNREIVRLLFERNAFDNIATVNTASALFYYSPTILTYGGMAVVAKVYYSIKDTKTLMNISIVTIVLNALFDYILMKPLFHNGLALSTSIVSVFQFVTAYYVLKKKVDISMGRYLPKNLFKISAASAIMGIAIYLGKTLLKYHSLTIFTILAVISGTIIYFVMLLIFKVDEFDELKYRLIRKRREA